MGDPDHSDKRSWDREAKATGTRNLPNGHLAGSDELMSNVEAARRFAWMISSRESSITFDRPGLT